MVYIINRFGPVKCYDERSSGLDIFVPRPIVRVRLVENVQLEKKPKILFFSNRPGNGDISNSKRIVNRRRRIRARAVIFF